MEAVVQCFFCVLAAVGENNPGDVVVVCVHTFRLSSRESDELLFVVNETWCCRPLSSWDLKRRTSLLFMQMPFDATWTTARWEKTWMKCRHNYDCYPPRGSTDEARHLIIDRKTQFVSLNNAFFLNVSLWNWMFLLLQTSVQCVAGGRKLPLFSLKDMIRKTSAFTSVETTRCKFLLYMLFLLFDCRYNFQEGVREWGRKSPNETQHNVNKTTTLPRLWTFVTSDRLLSAMVV